MTHLELPISSSKHAESPIQAPHPIAKFVAVSSHEVSPLQKVKVGATVVGGLVVAMTGAVVGRLVGDLVEDLIRASIGSTVGAAVGGLVGSMEGAGVGAGTELAPQQAQVMDLETEQLWVVQL
jgi:uncharacterized membrane protein